MTKRISRPIRWKPFDTAPKTGEEIIARDEEGNEEYIFWSDRPVCMLGSRNGGHSPGWAVGFSGEADTNLPLDDIFVSWR